MEDIVMKKKYTTPQMEAVDIKPQGILCGSITLDGNTVNINPFGNPFDPIEFEDDETIN